MKDKDIRVSKIENTNKSMYIEFNKKSEITKYWIEEDVEDEELYNAMNELKQIIQEYFFEKKYSLIAGYKILKYTLKNLEDYIKE